jgi:hypothetical protein
VPPSITGSRITVDPFDMEPITKSRPCKAFRPLCLGHTVWYRQAQRNPQYFRQSPLAETTITANANQCPMAFVKLARDWVLDPL